MVLFVFYGGVSFLLAFKSHLNKSGCDLTQLSLRSMQSLLALMSTVYFLTEKVANVLAQVEELSLQSHLLL